MENLYLINYKDIVQNIANLILDESRKDVTFVFKNSEETLKAHKCILEAVSPVFKSMFSGSFAEENEVKIDDIQPEVFKLFLSGIYLNEIGSESIKNKTNNTVTYADLYYAAEKYDIKDIREIAKKLMLSNCQIGNCHFLLNKAKLFNLPDLETRCKDFFQKNTYAVLACHIDLNLIDGYFHEFFDLENLAVKKEFDLYMALQAMVDNDKLLEYSQCLSKIRFLTMNTIDILNCNLLSADDKVAIISNIEAKKLQKAPKFPMPAHLSRENKPRKLSYVKNNRRYFWITIMLSCDNYEDYFEDFFKQMEILKDAEVKTMYWIKKGRHEVYPDGTIPRGSVHKVTKNIFSPDNLSNDG